MSKNLNWIEIDKEEHKDSSSGIVVAISYTYQAEINGGWLIKVVEDRYSGYREEGTGEGIRIGRGVGVGLTFIPYDKLKGYANSPINDNKSSINL